MLPLDCGLDFDPARDAEFFSALPPRPAVFLVELRDEKAEPRAEAHPEPHPEPMLGRTADLRRRMQRLLGPPEPMSKRLNLRDLAARVRYRLTGSAFEQSVVAYEHAKRLFPRRYRDLVRLRPAALLKVSLANAYPRCYVTRRIRADDATGAPLGGAYYGPFTSRRAADAFAEKFLDLFKVRRCQIKIRRDPTFPGCIYSEMKMCLAPCFAGCTKEEYDAEVGRLVRSLDTSGGSLAGEIEEEREHASEGLDFERAAALHKRLEKVNDVLRGLPELARRVEELDAVILQRAAEEQTIAVFTVRGGRLAEPFFLRFAELASQLASASQPRSAEEILRDQLAGVAADPGGDLGEHLGLVARWFYSGPRQGEIFFRAAKSERDEGDWPYRRILRACSRLLGPQTELNFAQDQQPREGPAPGGS